MVQVFELGGDVVPQQLAHNLMRLVAEGAGEEDEGADTELRSQAVQSYLELLAKPRLPAILLKVSPCSLRTAQRPRMGKGLLFTDICVVPMAGCW